MSYIESMEGGRSARRNPN